MDAEQICVPNLYREHVLRKHADLIREIQSLTDDEFLYVTGEERVPVEAH